MKLTKISPIEKAIAAIDTAIKELQQQRAELAAQLPPTKPAKPLEYLRHPITGEKCKINYN